VFRSRCSSYRGVWIGLGGRIASIAQTTAPVQVEWPNTKIKPGWRTHPSGALCVDADRWRPADGACRSKRNKEGRSFDRPFLSLDQLSLQVPDELTMRPPNCSAIPSGASLDIGELWLARTLLISSDTRSAVSLESKLLNPPTRPSAS
jgi:hypothetical protein